MQRHKTVDQFIAAAKLWKAELVELWAAFRKHRKAKTGFDKLTPGKRREYAEYVASAKRDETKQKRIEKILPMIASGIGLNDKYRGC